jgi:hypothetical protein
MHGGHVADNVFQEAAHSEPEATLPKVMDLVAKTANEVTKDFGSFIMGGLVPGLVLMFGSFALVFVVYGLAFLGAIPGLSANDDDLAGMGAVAGLFGGMLIGIPGLTLVITPLWGSMYRAVWALLLRGERLTVSSGWSTFGQDLIPQYVYVLLSGTIIFVGLLFCYVPGIIAQAMLCFAYPAIVIHRMGVGRAIQWSFANTLAHPGWHLGVWAVGLGISLILPNLPIVGYMLMFTVYPLFQLQAYRAAAGDGEFARDAS